MEADEDDGQLLKRCQRGDEEALAAIVRRYQRRVYALTLSVSGDAALSEEAVVDTFYKIWCKARQWRGTSKPESWIYRIAVRTVLDLKRRRFRWWKRTALMGASTSGESPRGTASEMIAEETARQRTRTLRQAIQTLKQDDRALVHMYYFEEKELKEIESILGVPRATLKVRLLRARRRLKKVLETSDEPEFRF